MSSNASAIPTAVTPAEAMILLDRMREVPGHRFLADDISLVVGSYLAGERVASHRHVTDAHLLAVARHHGARLATLDQGVVGLASGRDVVLVPAT